MIPAKRLAVLRNCFVADGMSLSAHNFASVADASGSSQNATSIEMLIKGVESRVLPPVKDKNERLPVRIIATALNP